MLLIKIMCRDGKGFWHEVQWAAKTHPCLLWMKPTSEKPARSCLEQEASFPFAPKIVGAQCPRKLSLIDWRCATGRPHDRDARLPCIRCIRNRTRAIL